MDSIEILKSLVGAGSAGAVILVVMLFLKDRKESDTIRKESDARFLERIEWVVTRHTEEERLNRAQITEEQRLNRAQIGELFTQTRDLFDRVIAICVDLTNAITQLKEQFREQSVAIENLAESVRRFEEFRGAGTVSGGPLTVAPPRRSGKANPGEPGSR